MPSFQDSQGCGICHQVKLACVLLERALEPQLPLNWVVADCVCSGYRFRLSLEQQCIQYVLEFASTSKFCVGFSQPHNWLQVLHMTDRKYQIALPALVFKQVKRSHLVVDIAPCFNNHVGSPSQVRMRCSGEQTSR